MESNFIYADEQIIFMATDTAMSPQLIPGSLLAGQYVETFSWNQIVNGVYAIVLDNGLVLIRRVKENNLSDTGILILYSDNSDHEPLQVNAEQIQSIYAIHEIIKQGVV